MTADAMARTKGPLNPCPTMPNGVTRNLRDRRKLQVMTVVPTVAKTPKKNGRAGRSKKRSNGGQAPRLDLCMVSDEELGDEECDNEEPVPRTPHVTPPLSLLPQPLASCSKKRSNGGQAPRLDLCMLSDEELGDEERDNKEPVPRTWHVTPPPSPFFPTISIFAYPNPA